MRAHHIKRRIAADGERIGKRLEHLDKPHKAQIFARREEVIILAAFPVCIVYYRLFPYYGDKLHDFSLVVLSFIRDRRPIDNNSFVIILFVI